MKIISILCALVALACTSLFANPNIVPIGGSKYARLSEDKTFISTGDYKTGNEDTLLVFSKMRVNPLDSVEAFLFSPDGNRILLRASFENYYVYKIESRRSDKLSTIGTQSKPMFSPDGKKIAFVRRRLFPTIRYALSLGALFFILAFSFSGFTFPVEAMPGIVKGISVLFPLRFYYLFYVQEALFGAGFAAWWPFIVYMLLFLVGPILVTNRLWRAYEIQNYPV